MSSDMSDAFDLKKNEKTRKVILTGLMFSVRLVSLLCLFTCSF